MSVHLRLRNLERKARNSVYPAGPSILIQTGDSWQLVVNCAGGKQITTIHNTEVEAHAEFEKIAGRDDPVLIIVDV